MRTLTNREPEHLKAWECGHCCELFESADDAVKCCPCDCIFCCADDCSEVDAYRCPDCRDLYHDRADVAERRCCSVFPVEMQERVEA